MAGVFPGHFVFDGFVGWHYAKLLPIVINHADFARALAIDPVLFERQLNSQLRCWDSDAILSNPGGVKQIEPASDAGRPILTAKKHDRSLRHSSTRETTVARPPPSTRLQLGGSSDSETHLYRER